MLVIKQLLFILTNVKPEEIDYFEAVFLLNIDENMPLRSRAILTSRRSMHLLAMSLGTSFILTLISIE